jgi:ankyrin repeat protein
MSDEKRASLPDDASIEWLRKHAKKRLRELRTTTPTAKLADAQLLVAREYGFSSWRALKAHIDSLSLEGQLFAAAKSGDLPTLRRILKENPALRDVRSKPYEHSLLHAAAQHGQLRIVEHLIGLGIDVNYREKGDNTHAMHWAAANGSLPVVRALADAGGDIVGHGDDHAMEVIGWACMWDGADDDAHRAVVDFLLSRGAKHHIFSAIAMDLPDEVRRIVKENPAALDQRQSHNESFRPPLHYAVSINRSKMVELLLELGADPLGADGSPWHYGAVIEARNPTIDLPIMRAYAAQPGAPVLFAYAALHDWDRAEELLQRRPDIPKSEQHRGSLHLMAKRGDAAATKWLLDHGFDPNQLWDHYDAKVTPLHMAAWGGHVDVTRVLLDAGADPMIKDSKHDSNAIEWAEFFGRVDIVQLLRAKA